MAETLLQRVIAGYSFFGFNLLFRVRYKVLAVQFSFVNVLKFEFAPLETVQDTDRFKRPSKARSQNFLIFYFVKEA